MKELTKLQQKLVKLQAQEVLLNDQLNACKIAVDGVQAHNILRSKLDECMRAQAHTKSRISALIEYIEFTA